ncbi:HAD family hydrolase [Pseudoteredinibacter isoporae]|uniref:Uncharacterized protein n=1 Tax=Pseudoteredinibacter isoporae TaxID=570281 RepID=A0A7X0MW47_9GAMM|nr:HAD family hydrolase [Pseudoteredinibacter isoporae]MBB6521805.1 hypothetical protein [Pseudoteredinibacter isoporae]NHO87350.1 HAD-IIB family hydrolase [Pseudoteredinibacter isoporae]NIB23174.1 HAD-IIB family hydrolase [Pseudoteredinibacter isoporae]
MQNPKPLSVIEPDTAKETKLIFFDVDGTLLDSSGQFSDVLQQQLKRLRERGLSLAIASGRPPFACRFLFEQLGLVDTGLFYTGGLIYQPSSDKTFTRHSLANDDARDLFYAARELGLYFELYDSERFILDVAHQCAPHITAEHSRQLRCEPEREVIETLLLRAEPEATKSGESPWIKVLLGEDARESDFLPQLEARFPELHFAYAKLPSYPDWRFASVIPKAADKHLAFDRLLDHYQLASHQVMAFGDAGSDKVFLQRAGVGVAMGSAVADVQACADFLCPSSDEEGVALALASFFPE